MLLLGWGGISFLIYILDEFLGWECSRRGTQITPFSFPFLHICTDLHLRSSALIKPELVLFFQPERSTQAFSPPNLVSTKDQVQTALMDNAEQLEKREHIYNKPNVAGQMYLWISSLVTQDRTFIYGSVIVKKNEESTILSLEQLKITQTHFCIGIEIR